MKKLMYFICFFICLFIGLNNVEAKYNCIYGNASTVNKVTLTIDPVTKKNTATIDRLDKKNISKSAVVGNIGEVKDRSCPNYIVIVLNEYNMSIYGAETEEELLSIDGANSRYVIGNPITNFNNSEGETINQNQNGESVNTNNLNTTNEKNIEEINFCGEEGVLKSFQIIGYVLFILKIVVPLLLIGLAMIDFAKAVVSSDEKAPKTAISIVIRRIIIAVIIFVIPTALNFLLLLIDDALDNGNGTVNTTGRFTDCTTCVLDPFECKL